MSSMVCRGVQSCFEPLLFEPCGLKNSFIQPKPIAWPQIPLTFEHQNVLQENPGNQEEFNTVNKNSKHNFDHQKNNKDDTSGWNFIESLSNKNDTANQNESVYVHPLVKKSSSVLSLKSLEMCTESLGSETGSDSNEALDELSPPLSPMTNQKYRNMWSMKYENFNKKVAGNNNFPPPLTSISGSGSVQVTPHREGGRLVLKAATVTSSDSYFQAERVDGRLTLRLVEDNYPNCEENEEYEDKEYEYDDDNDNENWDEDIDGYNENVRGEMGIDKRPVPSRCKENENENKRMPTWGPCWVAIS